MESMRPSFGHDDAAWNHFVRGYALQMSGQLNEAFHEYQASINLHPTAEAYTFLGWTHSMTGNLGEAIACCHQAIAVDGDFGNPYNDIGAYLIQLGRPIEAIPWLRRATRAARYDSPHYPYANLGSVYEQLNQRELAILHYRQALEHEPNYEFARKRLIHLISEHN